MVHCCESVSPKKKKRSDENSGNTYNRFVFPENKSQNVNINGDNRNYVSQGQFPSPAPQNASPFSDDSSNEECLGKHDLLQNHSLGMNFLFCAGSLTSILLTGGIITLAISCLVGGAAIAAIAVGVLLLPAGLALSAFLINLYEDSFRNQEKGEVVLAKNEGQQNQQNSGHNPNPGFFCSSKNCCQQEQDSCMVNNGYNI